VRVPRHNLLGGLNNGWQVAMTTLANERGTMSLAMAARFFITYNEMLGMCRKMERPVLRDPKVRQQLAQFYVDLQGLKYTLYRSFSKVLRGGTPGPEGSVSKLTWSELNQRMHEFAMHVEGQASQLTGRTPYSVESGRWQYGYLRSRANTIEAGTSEIQRNIIAERVLGLPRAR
jgi:alkylation response protein AidB-like acyl-CoA dehydrogenase